MTHDGYDTMKSNGKMTPADTKKFKFSAHSQRFALESRLVFDGAIAATAADIQPDNHDDLTHQTDNTDLAIAPGTEPNVDFAPNTDSQPLADDLAYSPILTTASTPAPNLIIVDARADNAAELQSNPPAHSQVLTLDSQQDGYQQISALLQDRHDINSLHILPFNDGNQQWLGSKPLDAALEPSTSRNLAHWGDGFTAQGEVIFHGEQTASPSWLNHVSALTGTKASWSHDDNFATATSDAENQSALPLFVLADGSSNYADVLNTVQTTLHDRLTQWVTREDYLTQAAIPFSANAGSQEWLDNAQNLKDSIINDRYSIRLELRSATELNNALGAYSHQGTTQQPTLYLNSEYLATATPAAIESVLLEELGHDFDYRLNGDLDSQGDEGHAFVGLLLYNNANLAVNLQDNDQDVLNLDGQAVAIEAAGSYSIAQTTFVPMSELDIQTSLKSISTSVAGNIKTTISIASTSNGTIVVYDQWEDGYEIDIKNPIQSSTLIWGDGNLTNGTAPGTSDDLFSSGKSIILSNDVIPGTTATVVDFDGRDKIGSTKAIAVSRTGYSITPGSVLAGAVNVIDSGNAGKNYIIPIGGTNAAYAGAGITANSQLFEYTSAHIIATQDNTVVSIYKTGDSIIDATVTLNQGQTYLVNGGITAGGTITATKGIGVYL
ncbi:MAG: DUF4347 domain-containing protein, partial [Methylococcaceae bacterium]